MAIKVGIKGFARIGRNVLRTAIDDRNIEIVAVNDLTSPATRAHLLKYDSILGNLKHDIKASGDTITIDGRPLRAFSEKDPTALLHQRSGGPRFSPQGSAARSGCCTFHYSYVHRSRQSDLSGDS